MLSLKILSLKSVGHHTKHLVLVVNANLSVVGQTGFRDPTPKIIQIIATGLFVCSNFIVRPYCLKKITHYLYGPGHREMKLILTRKIPLYWLVFRVL